MDFKNFPQDNENFILSITTTKNDNLHLKKNTYM
jgi:hypothetical protein